MNTHIEKLKQSEGDLAGENERLKADLKEALKEREKVVNTHSYQIESQEKLQAEIAQLTQSLTNLQADNGRLSEEKESLLDYIE